MRVEGGKVRERMLTKAQATRQLSGWSIPHPLDAGIKKVPLFCLLLLQR